MSTGIDTELCERFEDEASTLAADIAPSDLPNGVLVVRQSELPAEYRTGHLAFVGTAATALCAKFSPRFIEGLPCIVRGDDVLVDMIETMSLPPGVTKAEASRQLAYALLLHELAHLLVEPGDYTRPPLAWNPDLASVVAYRLREPAPVAVGNVPFTDHEASWLRAAIHVHFRARRLGVWVNPQNIIDGPSYGLSDFDTYAAALGREPFELRNASFREIAMAPVPPAFEAIWRLDLGRWAKSASPAAFEQFVQLAKSPLQ